MLRRPNLRSCAFLAIALAGAAVYARIFSFGFLADDFSIIEVPGLWVTKDFFFRPLPALLTKGLFALFGQNAVPFHALSLALHLANACLVFLLLEKALKSVSFLWPLGGALFFVTAYAPSEAVYWIACLNSLLEAFFVLSSVLMFAKYLETKQTQWLALCAAAWALGLCSRESAVVAPALWLGWAWLQNCALPAFKDRKSWLAFMPVGVLYLGIKFMGSLTPVLSHQHYRYELGWHLPRNLWQLWLACFYGIPVPDGALVIMGTRLLSFAGLREDPGVCAPKSLALICLLGLAAGLVFLFEGGRASRFGLLWFAVVFLPYAGLPGFMGIYPHRFTYLAMVGVLVAWLAFFSQQQWRYWRGLGGGLLLILGLLSAVLTWERSADYRMASQTIGRFAHSFDQSFPEPEGRIFVVRKRPDAHAGVYVFRNGIDSFLRLHTGVKNLEVFTHLPEVLEGDPRVVEIEIDGDGSVTTLKRPPAEVVP